MERRSIRSHLSKQFIAFTSIFIGITVAVFGRTIWVIANLRSNAVNEGLNQDYIANLTASLILAVVAGAALIFVAVGIMTYITYRIYGPMVSLKRLITQLADGHYTARGNLRKGDEFQDLMADLNTLAAKLEERHSTKETM